jgi:hypothetical protein
MRGSFFITPTIIERRRKGPYPGERFGIRAATRGLTSIGPYRAA